MTFTAKSRNFNWFRYVDDSARNRALRADAVWGANANSGLVAFNAADAPIGRQTKRNRVRTVTYQDPVTFRTVKLPFGTAAAFAAAPATVSISLPGLETAITYNIGKKTGESFAAVKAVRQAAEETAAT
jgi:hypothetical protein